MSHDLTISLSEPAWQLLAQQAAQTGTPPQQIVQHVVEQHLARQPQPAVRKAKAELSAAERQQASERLRRSFGAVNLGYPTGADNESIDADLAREYADNHEPR